MLATKPHIELFPDAIHQNRRATTGGLRTWNLGKWIARLALPAEEAGASGQRKNGTRGPLRSTRSRPSGYDMPPWHAHELRYLLLGLLF